MSKFYVPKNGDLVQGKGKYGFLIQGVASRVDSTYINLIGYNSDCFLLKDFEWSKLAGPPEPELIPRAIYECDDGADRIYYGEPDYGCWHDIRFNKSLKDHPSFHPVKRLKLVEES